MFSTYLNLQFSTLLFPIFYFVCLPHSFPFSSAFCFSISSSCDPSPSPPARPCIIWPPRSCNVHTDCPLPLVTWQRAVGSGARKKTRRRLHCSEENGKNGEKQKTVKRRTCCTPTRKRETEKRRKSDEEHDIRQFKNMLYSNRNRKKNR